MIVVLLKIAVVVGVLMMSAAYLVLLERRVAAWVQDRHGPNRVGIPLTKIRIFGLGQPLADGLKMIFKEEYTPGHVDRTMFTLAPLIIMTAAVAIFAVIPFGSQLPPIEALGASEPIPLVIAPAVDVGLLYVFALSGIAVYGVILGGWASNNKYSFLGALRSSAQLISYELPLGLGILGIVLATGSLRLDTIIEQQASSGWFVLTQPLGMLVFIVAAFAEAGRLPFDLPEAEQELIGGYHTEYAGIKLVMFLTAEFIHMITASVLIVVLFFGGWHLPWISSWLTDANGNATIAGAIVGIVVLLAKTMLLVLFFMVVRWSWPRFRFDQLMALAWKVMLPLGLVNFVAVALVEEAAGMSGGFWLRLAAGWGVLAAGWLAVSWAGPIVADNRPRKNLPTSELLS